MPKKISEAELRTLVQVVVGFPAGASLQQIAGNAEYSSRTLQRRLIRTNLCPLSFVDVPERAYIDGILGVYELNRLDLLREVFIWAYERSCARYSAVRQSLGNPDPFRMKYRQAIMQTVGEVVLGRMAKQPAAHHIQERAKRHAKPLDQKRFVEVAETELMNLHEGNISRYRLRPSDFFVWRETWS